MTLKKLTTLLLLSYCFSHLFAQENSQPDEFDRPRKEVELNNYYLSLNIHNLLGRYTEKIEWKIDSLIKESDDHQIQMNLNLLKYNLTNVYSKTIFHTDPVAGALDSWVLGYQLANYFRRPQCQKTYGIHCAALFTICNNYTRSFEDRLDEYITDDLTEKIQTFAANHPIENTQLNRRSVIPLLSAWISEEDLKLKTGLLTMTDLLRELSFRMEYYAEMLPKQTKWQLQHELASYIPGDSMIALINETHSLLRLTTKTLRSFENLIETNRDILLNNIDYQRTESFAELAKERELVLDAIKKEREEIQNFIDNQRLEAMSDVGDLTTEGLSQTKLMGKDLIDYVFIRMLIFLALAGAIVLVSVWLYRRN